LFGFNVGLEAGQIAVVMIVLALSYLFVQVLKVNRREWVIFTSAAAFGVAVQMAMQRIP